MLWLSPSLPAWSNGRFAGNRHVFIWYLMRFGTMCASFFSGGLTFIHPYMLLKGLFEGKNWILFFNKHQPGLSRNRFHFTVQVASLNHLVISYVFSFTVLLRFTLQPVANVCSDWCLAAQLNLLQLFKMEIKMLTLIAHLLLFLYVCMRLTSVLWRFLSLACRWWAACWWADWNCRDDSVV